MFVSNSMPLGRWAAILTSVATGAIMATYAATPVHAAPPALTSQKPVPPVPQGPALGAYDPYGDFSVDQRVSIEHLFLPWEDVELSTLAQADEYALRHNRTLLITIEPWSWDQDARVTPNELRRGMRAGSYDPNIKAVCSAIGALKSQATIRWGQEMEHDIGRFIWAGWRPADYVSAYRRFVDKCRPEAKTARFMWSPRGDENLAPYYPGDGYVDVIGLSIFGLQQMDQDEVGRDRSFVDLLKPAYERVAAFGKPVAVAELAYLGDRGYVERWAEDATRTDPALFPQLTSVVYFNDREPYPWPNPYGNPNWRVGPTSLTSN